MQNVFEYLRWRGDLSFTHSPQNSVDALIFSELSYIPFDKIVPCLDSEGDITLKEAADKFFNMHSESMSLGAILPHEIITLLKKASQTQRFSEVRLWGYENDVCVETEKQFSAICFSCENKVTYVVYRGTDDTIVGWKEDLNMALFTPIPSQTAGVKYLNSVAKKTKDKIIVSGHSKGGNIAVYSSLNAEPKIKKRTEKVYSFDGPGFKEEFLLPYKDDLMVKKITTVLPSKSVVGRIFDIIGNFKIIKSLDKGIQQHNAFTWMICGNDFVSASEFEKPSDNFHELLKVWVAKMSPEQRHEFVESFYKIAISSDASTLTEITNQKFKFIKGFIKTEGSSKRVVIDAVFKLIKEKNALTAATKKEQKTLKKSDKKKKRTDKKD